MWANSASFGSFSFFNISQIVVSSNLKKNSKGRLGARLGFEPRSADVDDRCIGFPMSASRLYLKFYKFANLPPCKFEAAVNASFGNDLTKFTSQVTTSDNIFFMVPSRS